MAADKSDEPGVLGNLPRSRPGHRSAKRGAGARGGAAARPSSTAGVSSRGSSATKATRAKTSATVGAQAKPSKSRAKAEARAKPPATRARSTPPPQPEREPVTRPGPESRGSTDPLTGAVRLAGKVAEAGLKTAGGLLKRLPGR